MVSYHEKLKSITVFFFLLHELRYILFSPLSWSFSVNLWHLSEPGANLGYEAAKSNAWLYILLVRTLPL